MVRCCTKCRRRLEMMTLVIVFLVVAFVYELIEEIIEFSVRKQLRRDEEARAQNDLDLDTWPDLED